MEGENEMSAERLDHAAFAGRLGRYEMGGLTEEERRAVEAHALECDACFAELERGSVVSAAMRDGSTRFAGVLGEGPASGRREGPSALGRLGELVRVGLRLRVAVPVLAVALLLAVVSVRHGGRADRYARLASFSRDELATTIVRGPNVRDAVRELMESGAGYFDTGRYDEAARRFRAALDRDPGLAEAAYLLGLSRALADDAAGAVVPLETATRLAGPALAPRASWALSNAHLRLGRVENARTILETLRTSEGEYGSKARALLEQLRR